MRMGLCRPLFRYYTLSHGKATSHKYLKKNIFELNFLVKKTIEFLQISLIKAKAGETWQCTAFFKRPVENY